LETLDYTQAGKPKKRGSAGRPSRLEIDPNLGRKIIHRLHEGHSMQEVADQLEINIRSLRMWARAGDRQGSGPMHEIAVAVKLSKAKRGFGGEHSKVDLAALPADTNPATAAPLPDEKPPSDNSVPEDPAGTGVNAWSSDFLDRWNVGELSPGQLEPLTLRMVMSGAAAIEPYQEPAKLLSCESDKRIVDLPAPGHFHVLKAASPGSDGWKEFQFNPKEFEALYFLCHDARNDPTQFVLTERRWPRDFKALTPEQNAIINRGARVLVRDSEGNYFQVDFKRAQY
jgi:hypothetical protein